MMRDIHQLVTRQVNRWAMDLKTYQEQLEEDFKTKPVFPHKPVITVSRQRGCRGFEFAKILASELFYGLFDREIIEYISEHMGVCSELVESLDEKNRSVLEQWVDSMLHQQAFDRDDYIRCLGQVIKTAALQGGIVILGRGANYLLHGTSAFHIRLIASLDTRIRNLQEFEGYTAEKAQEIIEKTDRSRADFVKKYFHKNINDPVDYDVVANMDRTSLDPAVKIVLTCLRARGFALDEIGGDKRKKR